MLLLLLSHFSHVRLCDPIDGSPPGSPVPGILQGRTLEWVAIPFSNSWKWKVKVKSLSHVWLFTTPWTAAYQALLSTGFSRQEYWSGCHCLLLFHLTHMRWVQLCGSLSILWHCLSLGLEWTLTFSSTANSLIPSNVHNQWTGIALCVTHFLIVFLMWLVSHSILEDRGNGELKFFRKASNA